MVGSVLAVPYRLGGGASWLDANKVERVGRTDRLAVWLSAVGASTAWTTATRKSNWVGLLLRKKVFRAGSVFRWPRHVLGVRGTWPAARRARALRSTSHVLHTR